MVKLLPGPLVGGGMNYVSTTLNSSTEPSAMIKVPSEVGGVSIQTYATASAAYSVYVSNAAFSEAYADVTTADDSVIWTLVESFTSDAADGIWRQYSGVCGALKVVCTTGEIKLSVAAK